MTIKSTLGLLKKLNPLKTIYFNFHYFPFMTAIHLPIFICWHTKLLKMRGEIVIDAPIRKGMMVLGLHTLGIKDPLYSRTIWEVCGKLIIKGSSCIGRGSKICIGKDAILTLGDNFVITGNSEIICQKEITFGKDCLLSWDILLIDTDFHHIITENGKIANQPNPIKIGNHIWVGCRSTILKGVTIADNNVISADSTITKSCLEENCIVGGHGKSQEVLRRGIEWKE